MQDCSTDGAEWRYLLQLECRCLEGFTCGMFNEASDAHYFQIQDLYAPTAGKYVSIDYPVAAGTTVFNPGQSVYFHWSYGGITASTTCSLYIWRRQYGFEDFRLCKEVSASAPNTGSFEYIMPRSIGIDCLTDGEAERYKVQLQCLCGESVCTDDFQSRGATATAFTIPNSPEITCGPPKGLWAVTPAESTYCIGLTWTPG